MSYALKDIPVSEDERGITRPEHHIMRAVLLHYRFVAKEAVATMEGCIREAAFIRSHLTKHDPGGIGHPLRRIVSAAMRNEKTGRVVMCVRHRDEIWRGSLLPGESPRDYDDGFVCSQRRFLSREEAWPIAFEAGQIIRHCGGGNDQVKVLYSENIC